MSRKCIKVPFSFQIGGIINTTDLLSDSGHHSSFGDDQTGKKSSLYQKVQSNIGKVIPGYDEDDGFIDDSEAVNASMQLKSLDPACFRISLVPQSTVGSTTSKPDNSKKSNDENNVDVASAVSEALEPYFDRLNTILCPYIEDIVQKIHSNLKVTNNIPLNEEMIEIIRQCVDEKVRIETEYNSSPSKKKVEQWKKDCLNMIFQKCFSVAEYKFTSLRRLQVAYSKVTKKGDDDLKDEKSKDETAKNGNQKEDDDE